MRAAKISDVWRNIYKKNNYIYKLEKLEFENIKGLGSGNITFSGGITIICGANGMGKTTLLNSLFLAVKDISSPLSHVSEFRFSNSLLLAHVIENNIPRTYLKDALGVGSNNIIDVGYIDSSSKSIAQNTFFSQMTNLEELLAQYGVNEYDSSDLESLSSITGKRYSLCSVVEIDDFSIEQSALCGYDGIIPYFLAIEDGVEYGSENMGSGELAAHILFWVIKRINNNSMLFIEEPETFISPVAQSKLVSYMAHFAMTKNIWLILTTHSMGIVSNVPTRHIKLLSKNSANVSILENPTRNQIGKILNLTSAYSNILFVEDLASKTFVRSLINSADLDLSSTIDIVIADSASSISSILYTFPKTTYNWVQIIGVYDGDIKIRIKDVMDIKKTKWNFVFLPKDVPPELVIREYINNNHIKFAVKVNLLDSEVLFALGNLKGENFHDWPRMLAEYLNLSEEIILKNMFDLWVEDNAHKEEIAAFYKMLQRAIKEEPGSFIPSS